MSPSAEEAALALREIDEIRARAAGFQDYYAESGQLLLWGAAYAVGFVLSALLPAQLLVVWAIVVAATITVGTLVARASNSDISGIAWRYIGVISTILVFTILVQIVMWPISAEQGAMVAPLLIAVLYILRGLQLRPRYLVIGSVLVILCSLGFVFLRPYFWWWMALATGGTLFLSGLWLRRF